MFFLSYDASALLLVSAILMFVTSAGLFEIALVVGAQSVILLTLLIG